MRYRYDHFSCDMNFSFACLPDTLNKQGTTPGESQMTIAIQPEDYRKIEAIIASGESPVGIDAKKTHILILHQLGRISARLDAIEQELAKR